MRRLDGGERERHLRAKDLRNLRPRAVLGPYSGSLVGHYEPARSDHGQRPKAKMPRWCAARRGA